MSWSWEEARRMKSAGVSEREIAIHFGINPHNVHYRLKRGEAFGGPRSPRQKSGPPRPAKSRAKAQVELWAELERLVGLGWSVTRIARHLGLNRTTIDMKVLRGEVYGYGTTTTQPRICLGCRETFESEGAGNRICGTCRKTPAWHDGQDVEFASPGVRL